MMPTTPNSAPRRFRRVLPILLAAGVVAAGAAAWRLLSPRTRPEALSHHTSPASSGPSVRASSSTSPWRAWPEKATVVGVPNAPIAALPPVAAPSKLAAEPPAATPEQLHREAMRKGEDLQPATYRAMLLDPARSSSIKLTILDKLKARPPEESVPILAAFLDAPGSAGTSYTKPTAVKILAELRHPLADEALASLSRTSADERVRLTIAALRAKEMSR